MAFAWVGFESWPLYAMQILSLPFHFCFPTDPLGSGFVHSPHPGPLAFVPDPAGRAAYDLFLVFNTAKSEAPENLQLATSGCFPASPSRPASRRFQFWFSDLHYSLVSKQQIQQPSNCAHSAPQPQSCYKQATSSSCFPCEMGIPLTHLSLAESNTLQISLAQFGAWFFPLLPDCRLVSKDSSSDPAILNTSLSVTPLTSVTR